MLIALFQQQSLVSACHTDEGAYLFAYQQSLVSGCHTDEGVYLFADKTLKSSFFPNGTNNNRFSPSGRNDIVICPIVVTPCSSRLQFAQTANNYWQNKSTLSGFILSIKFSLFALDNFFMYFSLSKACSTIPNSSK